MAGEVDLTLCEPTACGDPWHGLTVAGVLSLDNGTFKSIQNPPEGGDCFVFRIPGLPAPELSPDDVAAGRRWLNYAVISGKYRRLYGINLGVNAWLYLDSAGVVWRAVASWVDATVTVTMTNIRDTTLTGSGSASVSPSFYSGSHTVYGVVDMASDGRKVVVSFGQDSITKMAAAFVELSISGLGSAPTVEAHLLSEQGHVGFDSNEVTEDTYLKTHFRKVQWYNALTNHYMETPWVYSLTQAQLIANGPLPWPDPPSPDYAFGWVTWEKDVETGIYQIDETIGWVYGVDDLLTKVVFRGRSAYAEVTHNYQWSAEGTWVTASVSGTYRNDVHVFIGSIHAAPYTLERVGQGAEFVNTIGRPDQSVNPWRFTNRVFGIGGNDRENSWDVFFNPICPTGSITGIFVGDEPATSYQPQLQLLHAVEGQFGAVCYI